MFALDKPVIVAVNKIDRLKHGHVAIQMKVAAGLGIPPRLGGAASVLDPLGA